MWSNYGNLKMQFWERFFFIKSKIRRTFFFHQIKGTTMGTPMAVNLTNLFMRKFETDLRNGHRNKYNKSPGIWLRYIDDIFFTWDHDESSLKHYISFCNSYSANLNMTPKISFEADYSMSHVYFLNTKCKFNAHTLATELYLKPSASFQYLHRTSSHPHHTFRSIWNHSSYEFDAYALT